jgi:hypothetical protein
MSEEEEIKKKTVRRKNPAQLMKRGDDVFFVVNSQIVEEPILACLKWGKPCDRKDEKITLGNVCWFHTPKHGTRRILRNSDNKLRIPSDEELIKIYSKTTKKEGDTITLKGIEIKVFDPRWAKLKGKSAPKKKKPTTKKRKVSDDEKRIAKLEKELKNLKKKKKK